MPPLPTTPATVPDALAAALRADPGRPLVTFYDDAMGERIELSVKTFDNWVSKIANLFSHELMLSPGDNVAIDLPTHWLSPVTAVAAWVAGLVVTLPSPGQPPSSTAARIVGPPALADSPGGTGQVVACSLRPLGGRFVEPLPAGWLDFGAEVPAQPDVVLDPVPAGPDTVAADHHGRLFTQAELVQAGLDAADRVGLSAGGRLATDINPMTGEGLAVSLLGPLVTGSSVVLVVNADVPRRDVIASQERVTCQAWVTA
ncbi:MAG: TIGR03089 family protein [Nocardioidaceae bacterium]